MAQIRIDLAEPLLDGMDIKFKAPCNCNEVTGLKVYYPQGDTTSVKEFTFRDTHGNDLTGLGNLFFEGTYVKVLVDAQNGYAYLQNADTNSYIETKLSMELLWKNAKPNSTMTTGSAPCDRTGYDFIRIEFLLSTSFQIHLTTESENLETGGMMLLQSIASASNKCARNVDFTDDGFSFREAVSTTGTPANYCIPYAIYGIKGAFA